MYLFIYRSSSTAAAAAFAAATAGSTNPKDHPKGEKQVRRSQGNESTVLTLPTSQVLSVFTFQRWVFL